MGKINALYDERMSKIAVLAEAGVDAAAISEAQYATLQAQEEDLHALKVKNADELAGKNAEAAEDAAGYALDLFGAWNDMFASMAEARLEQMTVLLSDSQAKVQKLKEAISAAQESGNAEAEAKAQKRFDNQIAGERAVQRYAKDAAMNAFRTSQDLAKAQAVGDAAAAMISLTGSMAYLGFGAPIAAAAIVAPMLVTSLNQINSNTPPSFAAGGVVGRAFGEGSTSDHVTIQADPREGIVSARGMDALGANGLESLNAGGGFGGSLNVTLVLDGQTLAAAVATPSVKRAIVAELRLNQGAGRGTSYGRG